MNLRIKILFNLLWSGYIGGRHTSVDNVIKNFPRSERKKARKTLRKCYNDGFLILKPTHYGQEVSINPRMIKESEAFRKYEIWRKNIKFNPHNNID